MHNSWRVVLLAFSFSWGMLYVGSFKNCISQSEVRLNDITHINHESTWRSTWILSIHWNKGGKCIEKVQKYVDGVFDCPLKLDCNVRDKLLIICPHDDMLCFWPSWFTYPWTLGLPGYLASGSFFKSKRWPKMVVILLRHL